MRLSNSIFRLFTLASLALPLPVLAGDPIPGIDITVIQADSGIEKSGTTNEKGELVLSGFEPGPCMVKIKRDGRTTVMGQDGGQQIIIPKEEVAIKPIRLELAAHRAPGKEIDKATPAARMMAQNHNSSRSNRSSGVALDDDDDGDGFGNPDDGNRAQNHNSSRSNRTSGVALDDDDDGDGILTARQASNHNTTRSNRISPVAPDSDDDCNDVAEITPMADGRIRIVVSCE